MGLVYTLLLFVWQGQAPPAPADTPVATLEGRVIHSISGEPVPRAVVALRTRPTPGAPITDGRSAQTDANGKFRIENVEAGTYFLTAEKTGFLRQAYGARANTTMFVPFTVNAGEQARDLVFKLVPQGVITGKVVDDDGEPVPRASVNVMRQTGFGGQPAMGRAGMTNDVGEFRLAELAPGRYVLRVMPGMGMGEDLAPVSKDPDKPREGFVPTFYPGVADAANAAPLEIAPGQQMDGVVVRLARGRVFRISGRTAAPEAGRLLRVMLMPRERSQMMMGFGGTGAMARPDGTFVIRNVRPGAYHVVAMEMQQSGPGRMTPIARAPVDILDSDIEDLVLRIEPAVELAGVVRTAGEQKLSLAGARVFLISAEGVSFNTPSAVVDAEGAFKLTDVAQDRYHLNVMNIPEPGYLRSARFGTEETLKRGLQVTGPGTLELVIGTDAGAIHGLVQQGDTPLAGGYVILLPDPATPESGYLRKTATTDQNGRYELKGVAPGSYRLYAFPEAQYVADMGAFKPLEEKSAKVTVRENGREQVDVKVIELDR
jgi:hypothetical protein